MEECCGQGRDLYVDKIMGKAPMVGIEIVDRLQIGDAKHNESSKAACEAR